MKHRFEFFLLPAIALLATAYSARAIGITLDQIGVGSSVNEVSTLTQMQSAPLPFSIHTSQIAPDDSRASTDWAVTNTATQAVFNDSFFLSNNRPFFSGSDGSRIDSGFQFTLTESVNYSLTGSIFGTLDENALARLRLTIGNVALGFPGFEQSSDVITTVSGAFSPAAITGTLNPGSYSFQAMSAVAIFPVTGSASIGSELFGDVSLVLTAIHPHVPDAGSTLGLLGMALTALGATRYRYRA